MQKQGALLFGTLDLAGGDTHEATAAIGLRTANDKSMALPLAVGRRLTVCDNLCLAGDLIALRRRHTAPPGPAFRATTRLGRLFGLD